MFEERERGFEAKFQHDEALRFRVHARRNKLFGLWAAQKLRRAGTDAHRYALDLVTDLGLQRDEALLEKVSADLRHEGSLLSDAEIATALSAAASRAAAIVLGRDAEARPAI
jgi:hypothetical protein